MEHLEPRTMLAGDHPSLPGGNPPWASTAVALDFMQTTDSPLFGRGSATGTVAAGDPGDLFRFVMPTIGDGGKPRDFVTVLADTIPGNSTLDSMVEVYDDAGRLITRGRDNGPVSVGLSNNPAVAKSPDGWAGFEGFAGRTYYIRVLTDSTVANGRTATGNYTLRIDAVSLSINLDNSSTDPAVFGTGRESDNVRFRQDDVIYQITTPNDPRFDSLSSFQATTINNNVFNPHLDLYSTGDSLGAVQRLTSDTDSGRQTDAFGAFRTSKNTTYYLRIRSDDLRDAATPAQSVGAYTTFVRMAAQDVAIDPITRLGQTDSESIVGPDGASGGLFDGTGLRLFRFTAQGTGQGFVTLLGFGLAAGDGLINPAVRVYDDNGVSIDFNKALNSTAQISTPVVGGRSYYVIAEGFDSVADPFAGSRDGTVQLFIEAHHTYDPLLGVDDHVNTPGPGSGLLQWQNATPLRFGDPYRLQENWTVDGQTPVLSTDRNDHSWIQTAFGRGRLNTLNDTDLFTFTPPLNQLSDYAGDSALNTPGIYVGGNYATAGNSRVTGVNTKRNNISVWDVGDWFDTGATDIVDNAGNNLDGPLDGPVFAQTIWDPDGSGGLPAILVAAGQFSHVHSVVDTTGAGDLIKTTLNASLAFRVFYPPENRFIWATTVGFRPVPNTNPVKYTTITDPIVVNGPIYALKTFVGTPNTLAGNDTIDDLFVGGDFAFAADDGAANSIFQLQYFPEFQAAGTSNMGGGVRTGAPNTAPRGIVRALEVYNPVAETDAMAMPPLPMITPSAGLYVGGLFSHSGAGNGRAIANNIVRWGPTLTAPMGGQPSPIPVWENLLQGGVADNGITATGATGGVYALQTYDAPGTEPDPAGGPDPVEIPNRLYIGGGFTRAGFGSTALSVNLTAYQQRFRPVGTETGGANGNRFPWAGIVRTMTLWNPPNPDLISTGPTTSLVVGADNGPLAPGSAFAATGVVARWSPANATGTPNPMAWTRMGTTLDGTVLSLTTATENERATEPAYQMLYVGGTFTQIQEPGGQAGGPVRTGLNRVARFSRFAGGFWRTQWSGLTTGVTGLSDPPPAQTITAVYSLAAFNDQGAGVFRRNSRPGSRVEIRVNRTPDSEETVDLFLRVYDSNFQLIYANNTVAPGFGDPAGANNPAFGANAVAGTQFIMPETWAGESYYLEVSRQGAFGGRYEFTVTTEALPPKDPNAVPDGLYTDTISDITKPVGQGQFTDAPIIQIDGNGYGRNFTRGNPGGPTGPGRFGTSDANPPSSYSTRFYLPDVQGFRRYQFEDPPVIASPNETHLFQFRAPNDGTAEIRVSTKDILRAFQEQVIDALDPGLTLVQQTIKSKTLNSPLHAAIRIFTNDRSTGQFVQTGFANYNFAMDGFQQTILQNAGSNAYNPPDSQFRTFTHNDPRIVIPVERGNSYFIQVESAYKGTFNTNPDLVDWRFATGAYEVMVRSTPGSINGGLDDHENAVGGTFEPTFVNDTSIAMNARTGAGSITGEIRNVPTGPFPNPVDSDVFKFISNNRGQASVTITPTSGTLQPRVIVVAGDRSRPAQATSFGAGQAVTVTFAVSQGAPFFLVVLGANGTEGTYRVDVQEPGLIDDQPFSDATDASNLAPQAGWANATPLSLNRWSGVYGLLGSGGAVQPVAGTIENADDRDIYKFTAEAYELAQVTVERVSTSLNPFVFVYEINKDNDGNDVFLLIAFNDDAAGIAPDAQASFSTTPGRDYYVVVTGANAGSDVGQYTMRVNVIPTDDHPNRADFPAGTDIPLALDSINLVGTGNVNGRIERTGDNDLFRFTAPADGRAIVTLSKRNASALALALTVIDDSNIALPGSRVSYALGVGGSLVVTISGVTTGTRYYLLVQAGTPGMGETNTGEYALGVRTETVDDHPNAGQFSIATNIPVNSGTGIGSGTGIVVPSTDTDLFRFSSVAIGTVTVRVSTPSSNLNPRLVIFNAGQSQIGAIDGNGDSATLTFNSTAIGQVFYVLVLPSTTAAGATAVGTYTVGITNNSTGGGGPDDFPNAGEWNDAALIAPDPRTGQAFINALINFAGDTDLFTFTPAVGGTVDVQMIVPLGSTLDGGLTIFDSSRNPIRSDFTGSAGNTATITFNALAGQQYYILAQPVGSGTGSYVLRLGTQIVTNFLYFPEGFAGGSIDEFVPLVNDNSFPVNWAIYARYETGASPDTPIATGVIGANRRDGVTIFTRGNAATQRVRQGVGYALEIRSDGPLGATFSHYDFGASIGESFTSLTSTTWTFGEVRKDPANFRDFLLFYNPNTTPVNITLEAFYTNGATATLNYTVDAMRRGGVNVNDSGPSLPAGIFGVRLTSSQPIVASHTSYNLPRSGGDGALGDATGGATRGAMPGIRQEDGVSSGLSILNANASTTTVTLVASYARADLTPVTRVIAIPARSTYNASLDTFGLVPGQIFGFTYTSTQNVTLSVTEYQLGDGDTTTTATVAARKQLLADLFIEPAQAGVNYIQRLSLYNPTGLAISVSPTFIFSDSAIAGTSITIAANSFTFVQLDQLPQILSRVGPTAYSLRLESSDPFVASLLNYNLVLGGGWSALGQPIGFTTPLSSIV